MNTEGLTRQMRNGLTLVVGAGLVIAFGVSMAGAARGGRTVRVRQVLNATGKAPGARGKVLLVVRAGKSKLSGVLDVGARRLARNGNFEVLIGGVKVGDLSANGGGNGKVRFRTNLRGRALVLGVDPRGKQIVLRDEQGDDVLEGDCPDDKPNAGKIACCVPSSADGAFDDDRQGNDDDEGDGDDDSCRRLTSDECAAVGGSSAGGSCLPDPCTTTPPSGAVCCVPESDDDDGEGAECENKTPDQCAAKGGTMISATGCEPNPCSPTPSADPRIACCTPDDGEMECHHRTAAECDAHQGVNMGPASCSLNPCGTPSGGGDGGEH